MSKMSGRRSVTAILSLLTIGGALSLGVARAVAANDVTEDQIVRALAPVKKPLTRGLSAGPQVDPPLEPFLSAIERFLSSWDPA